MQPSLGRFTSTVCRASVSSDQESANNPQANVPVLDDSQLTITFKNAAPGAVLPDVVLAVVLGETDSQTSELPDASRVLSKIALRDGIRRRRLWMSR
jgi:hypothetical protein